MSKQSELMRYEKEARKPEMVDGEYLVSVRDNDEARLILGLRLGVPYEYSDVRRAVWKIGGRAEALGCSKATSYRIMSAARRLKYFDPQIIGHKSQNDGI